MDATAVEALFTRASGDYLCARWGRPIVPVVFGVDDATLAVVKGAVIRGGVEIKAFSGTAKQEPKQEHKQEQRPTDCDHVIGGRAADAGTGGIYYGPVQQQYPVCRRLH